MCLHTGASCDPDLRDQVDTKEEARDVACLKEYVANVFPGLIPEPAIKERCIYTVSDIICVHTLLLIKILMVVK